jgi:hypothetical protein
MTVKKRGVERMAGSIVIKKDETMEMITNHNSPESHWKERRKS